MYQLCKNDIFHSQRNIYEIIFLYQAYKFVPRISHIVEIISISFWVSLDILKLLLFRKDLYISVRFFWCHRTKKITSPYINQKNKIIFLKYKNYSEKKNFSRANHITIDYKIEPCILLNLWVEIRKKYCAEY